MANTRGEKVKMVLAAVRFRVSGSWTMGGANLPFPDPEQIIRDNGCYRLANAVICRLPAVLVDDQQKLGHICHVGRSNNVYLHDNAILNYQIFQDGVLGGQPIAVKKSGWEAGLASGTLEDYREIQGRPIDDNPDPDSG